MTAADDGGGSPAGRVNPSVSLAGFGRIDVTFDTRLKPACDRAMRQGLWRGKCASTNHAEYFAEGMQSWFDNNRQPDHDHNRVDTRKELREYDPELAKLGEEVFGDTELTSTKPTTRLQGHLAGYDPAQSPEFKWPPHLEE